MSNWTEDDYMDPADERKLETEERLKSCPFCGSADVCSEDLGYNGLGHGKCITCGATGPEAQNPDGGAKAVAAWNRRAGSLKRLKSRIDTRLNNALCEMKPDYDDSIHGFNEAWDIVRDIINEEIAKAA